MRHVVEIEGGGTFDRDGREAGADRREVLPDGRGDAGKPRSRLPIA